MDSDKRERNVPTIDVHTARELLSSGHRYLDVRTEEEYNNGHVANAINVPYMFMNDKGKEVNPQFLDQVSEVCRKDERLIVGCFSGAISHLACNDLLDTGYENVTNMKDGYSAWVNAGFAGGPLPEKFSH